MGFDIRVVDDKHVDWSKSLTIRGLNVCADW